MKKLAIVTTHPIQYYAPWFKLLNEDENIEIKVFYTWSQSKNSVKDNVFQKEIKWDIPLLTGYNHEFIHNNSKNPGTHHKHGIICPDLIIKIEEYNPHAVLVFGWYLKSHMDVIKHFYNKIQVWFRGDSNLLDNSSIVKKLVRKLWLTLVYSKIDKAFYVGSENYKYYLQFGLSKEQLIYAPHAIDNKRFGDSESFQYEQKALAWRKELGFDRKDLVIVFAGKFENKKNPIMLLDNVQLVNKQRKQPLKLLLVGNGPLEFEIKKRIKYDTNILSLPFQNQSKMPLVYRLGDIFCLPSKGPGETWGLAVNEAMACKRGAIVSDKVGCANDLITNQENGFVFKHDDNKSLRIILDNLTKDICLIYGNVSYQKIQKFSFEKIVSAVVNSLNKIG